MERSYMQGPVQEKPQEETKTLTDAEVKEKVKNILPDRKDIEINKNHSIVQVPFFTPFRILMTLAFLLVLFTIAFTISYFSSQRKLLQEDVVPEAEVKLPSNPEIQYQNPQNFEIDLPEGWYWTNQKQFLTSYNIRELEADQEPTWPFTKCDFSFYEENDPDELSDVSTISIIRQSDPKITKKLSITKPEFQDPGGDNSSLTFYVIEDDVHNSTSLTCYFLPEKHVDNVEKILSTFKFID